MKTILCSLWAVFFLCLLACPLILAQTDSTAETKPSVNINSNRKYKHEAGIDISALNLIGGGNGSYPSVFYRRHKIVTKKTDLVGVDEVKYIAYRFRVGTNLSFKKMDYPSVTEITPSAPWNWSYNSFNNVDTRNYTSFFVRIGREREIRNGRFELFYGYDFFLQYDKTTTYWLYTNWYYDGNFNNYYNVNNSYLLNERSINYGISPIVGFKYFLLPRLCFSGEAKVDIGYEMLKKKQTNNYYHQKEDYYAEFDIKSGSKGFKMTISPLYVVNMGYYF